MSPRSNHNHCFKSQDIDDSRHALAHCYLRYLSLLLPKRRLFAIISIFLCDRRAISWSIHQSTNWVISKKHESPMTAWSANLYLAATQDGLERRREISFCCEWFDYVFLGSHISTLMQSDGFLPSANLMITCSQWLTPITVSQLRSNWASAKADDLKSFTINRRCLIWNNDCNYFRLC